MFINVKKSFLGQSCISHISCEISKSKLSVKTLVNEGLWSKSELYRISNEKKDRG